jgi:hypothetical protein
MRDREVDSIEHLTRVNNARDLFLIGYNIIGS